MNDEEATSKKGKDKDGWYHVYDKKSVIELSTDPLTRLPFTFMKVDTDLLKKMKEIFCSPSK